MPLITITGGRGLRTTSGRLRVTIAVVWVSVVVTVQAQDQYGSWIHRDASDTTWVRCLGDTASMIGFPQSCFGSGPMFPDSLYCRFELMPLDSLPHPYDSSFLHWRRIRLGSDSGNYDFLDHHGMGGGMHRREFQRQINYRWRWDSSLHDSAHRRWRARRVLCWNGEQWVSVDDAKITDSTINFSLADVYSSIAVIGEPEGAAGIDGKHIIQNGPPWPNPAFDFVHVRLSTKLRWSGEIRFFNSLGENVRSFSFDGTDTSNVTVRLNVSGLPAGVYYYEIRGERGHAMGSVVVR